MKIAYFELGFTEYYEDYSIMPKRYGGGPIFARWAKEMLNNAEHQFFIFAPAKCFDNLMKNERRDRCVPVSEEALTLLQLGVPLKQIFPRIDEFDIVCHHHTRFGFNKKNLSIPVVHWSGFGVGGAGHKNNDYILLFDHNSKAIFGEKQKYVRIGKTVPLTFKEQNKSDFIFQCTRHDELINTIDIAKECIAEKITGYFAGPIDSKYNLLDYIDNKNTFYVGIIPEQIKLEYTKAARLYTLPAKFDVNFNLSVVEANGFGTPVLASNRGWFKDYIKHGLNGYFYNSNLKEIFDLAKNANQQACWESASEFSIPKMVDSFTTAFQEILYEQRNSHNSKH